MGGISQDSSFTAKEVIIMKQYPESLTAKSMLGRWAKACIAGKWKVLPDQITKKYKEVPNFLRPLLQLPCKGPSTGCQLPWELQQAFDVYRRLKLVWQEIEMSHILARNEIVHVYIYIYIHIRVGGGGAGGDVPRTLPIW